MPVVHDVVPPWAVPLTSEERALVLYVTAVAGAALLAMLARILVTRTEVSDRYRPTSTAGTGVALVAFVSYLVVLLQVVLGYDHVHGMWVPNDGAIGVWIAPSRVKKMLAPVHSATRPSQSSIIASA